MKRLIIFSVITLIAATGIGIAGNFILVHAQNDQYKQGWMSSCLAENGYLEKYAPNTCACMWDNNAKLTSTKYVTAKISPVDITRSWCYNKATGHQIPKGLDDYLREL